MVWNCFIIPLFHRFPKKWLPIKTSPTEKTSHFPAFWNQVTICHTDQKPWPERSKLWVLAKMNFPRVRWIWSGNVVNLVGPVIPNLAGGGGCLDVDRVFFLDPNISNWSRYAACNVDLWFYQLANCASWNGLHAGKQKWHWQQSLNQET